jgi:hypothetical protein
VGGKDERGRRGQGGQGGGRTEHTAQLSCGREGGEGGRRGQIHTTKYCSAASTRIPEAPSVTGASSEAAWTVDHCPEATLNLEIWAEHSPPKIIKSVPTIVHEVPVLGWVLRRS